MISLDLLLRADKRLTLSQRRTLVLLKHHNLVRALLRACQTVATLEINMISLDRVE